MADHPLKVLVVDDEAAMREVLAVRLASWGLAVCTAGSAEEAERIARSEGPDVVISDVVLPQASGLDLLRRLKAGDPARPVVLITSHGSIDAAVEAMKDGAEDFLTKPLDYPKLRSTLAELERGLERRREARRLAEDLESGAGLGSLVGRSQSMQEVFETVRVVGPTDASVIVTGESGTGKELIARAIHDFSPRRAGPFFAVNVAAIPEGLTESELFGHERGAFTGAVAARAGCFELADGGTLFLDEVTEMPAATQPKFLRVLEEGRLRRVGGSREVAFDVRVIAATNRPPEQAVEQGQLRQDLYFRLNVFTIVLPPLRERGSDVALLVQHFIAEFDRKHGAAVEGVGDDAAALLAAYRWPGNVRELRNVVERAVILARRGLLGGAHLPPYLRDATGEPGGSGRGIVIPPEATAAEAERILILRTLDRVEGNKAEAARQLGLDVKTIRNKLKRYGVESEGE
ncbi:MAG: sigma-54-dependent transcriptional regulator [Acidobacteriota bacterium]